MCSQVTAYCFSAEMYHQEPSYWRLTKLTLLASLRIVEKKSFIWMCSEASLLSYLAEADRWKGKKIWKKETTLTNCGYKVAAF